MARRSMNKDQVRGSAKVAAGKVQRAAGKLVGSRKMQAKGLGKEIVGKTQQGLGNAREVMRSSPRARTTTRTRTTTTTRTTRKT